MPSSIRLGRVLVGFAMVGLGAICLRYPDFIMEWAITFDPFVGLKG